MPNKVQMWGNSLAIRIPKAIAESSKINQGTHIEFSLSDGSIILTPLKSPKYSLDQLLEGINKDNLHGEINTGNSVGKEIIE